MGKFVTCCGNRTKFRTRVCLKPSSNRGEYEFDWARCHKIIAESSFSLGHGTDSTYTYMHVHVQAIGDIKRFSSEIPQ